MKRYVIKSMTVREVSSVDKPAQKGATAVLLKRDGGEPEEFAKRVWMTTSIKGHAHLIDEQDYDGRYKEGGTTSWTQEEGEEDGHSHPWVRLPDGTIAIGEANGHTHDALETNVTKGPAPAPMEKNTMTIKTRAELDAAIAKAQGEGDKLTVATVTTIHKAAAELKMEDALPATGPLAKAKAKDDEDEDAKALKAKVSRMEKRDALSTDLRKHYDTLATDADRDAFLAKDAGAQQVELEKSAGSDPVVYTTVDGIEIRKSADPALVAMAKRADADRRDATLEKAKRVELELEKRAETELGKVGGTTDGKKALLKAVDAIEDEAMRKAATEVLAAANALAGKGDIFARRGSGAAPALEKGSGEDKLEELAKAYAKDNSVTYEVAYTKVLETAEGQELYKSLVEPLPAAA